MKYRVKALGTFKSVVDNEVGRVRKIGEEWIVSKERLDVLLGNNLKHITYVENLGEVKEEIAETKAEVKKEIKPAIKKIVTKSSSIKRRVK